MIYLFGHGGEEIDGVYQSHPIRTILADQNFGRLWALNAMENKIYSYMIPNNKNEIKTYLHKEEILFDFSNESFEPSLMIQSDQSIGFIDIEHDIYRLYSKENGFHLITTYQNLNNQGWKITNGIIFKDNRTLLKLTKDKSNDDLNDKNRKNRFYKYPQNRLIELTSDGQEKRQFQADILHSMVIGPNDEVILGFTVRFNRGLIHCY